MNIDEQVVPVIDGTNVVYGFLIGIVSFAIIFGYVLL